MKKYSIFFSFLLFALFTTSLPGQRIGDGFPATGRTFSVENFGEDLMRRLVEADNLIRRYRWEEAILAYDNVIAQDPAFSDAYVKRGLLKYRLGRFTEARQDLEIAGRLNPYAANIYGYNGRQGQLAVLAVNGFDTSLTVGQEEDPALQAFQRGLERKRNGDYPGALSAIETAMEIKGNPTPEMLTARGNLSLLFGYPNRAIEDYTQAIQLDENNEEAYYNRAIAQILAYNRISACYDLEQSARLGFEKAQQKLVYFCNQ